MRGAHAHTWRVTARHKVVDRPCMAWCRKARSETAPEDDAASEILFKIANAAARPAQHGRGPTRPNVSCASGTKRTSTGAGVSILAHLVRNHGLDSR